MSLIYAHKQLNVFFVDLEKDSESFIQSSYTVQSIKDLNIALLISR
jgi:hypothetical protein